MPSYYSALWSALRTAVLAAWPEIAADEIYRTQELARIRWENKVATLPLVVIDVDLAEGDWAADTGAEEGTVTFSYVVRDDTTPSAIEAKLETLRTYLFTTPLTAGEVVDYPRLTNTINTPVNAYFLQFQKPFWAGTVTARIVIHEA